METTVRQAAHKTQARLIVARRESSPMFFLHRDAHSPDELADPPHVTRGEKRLTPHKKPLLIALAVQ